MRFEIFALPILAAIAEAAAISSSKSSSSVCRTCPVTIQNTDAAMASVLSQMAAQSPKAAQTTTSITGSPIASSAVAKMTTSAAASAKSTSAASSSVKSSSVKLPSSTAKSSSSTAKSTLSSAKSTSSSVAKSSTSSTSTTLSSKKHQRRQATSTTNACATQANYGYTYVPANPAPSAFLKDTTLRQQYMSAAVPANYVWRFAGFYASLAQPGYISYAELSSYDTAKCASICNANSACQGFAIYFERSPKLLPAAQCTNPDPQTNVKCAFYSTAISEANAVNVGSWRSSFNVVITGANGYQKA